MHYLTILFLISFLIFNALLFPMHPSFFMSSVKQIFIIFAPNDIPVINRTNIDYPVLPKVFILAKIDIV